MYKAAMWQPLSRIKTTHVFCGQICTLNLRNNTQLRKKWTYNFLNYWAILEKKHILIVVFSIQFSIQNVFGERTRRVAFLNFFYCSQDFYGKNLYKQNEYKNNHKFNLND